MDINKIHQLEENNKEGLTYYFDIVNTYSKDLDDLIQLIKTEIISDKNYCNLYQYALELPYALYYLAERVEELGLKVDFAAIAKEDKYSRLLINAQGTIPEKQARATVFSNNEAHAKEIYERCYYALKTKINYGEQMLISLRALVGSMEREMQYA